MTNLILVLTLLVAVQATYVTAASFKDIVEEINNAELSWKAEHNHITNQGVGYVKKLLGSILPKNVNQEERQQIEISNDIPNQFDARVQWPNCNTIGAIRDQGHCGSCWAVSAANTATDRLCIQLASESEETDLDLDLSAENINSCCFYCSLLGGCNGGYTLNAWAFMAINGIVTGGDYNSKQGCQPYQVPPSGNSTSNEFILTPICRIICTNDEYSTPYFKDKHYIKKYYIVENNVNAIQSEMMTNGPVQASFDVYDDFIYYKSGVYVRNSSNLLGGHAVRLVGWGTDFASSLDYWLVANSWNTSWGDNGFFKILRGNHECGIEDNVIAGNF